MDIQKAIRKRKSVRAFTNDNVPDEVIRSAVDLALLSPSWGNTQPWETFVVTGKKLALLKKIFADKFEGDITVNPDIPIPTEWPDDCKRRYQNLGKELFSKIGTKRGDKEGRREHYRKMFQGFGAPAVVYLCLDKKLTKWALIDIGIFIQTFSLAAVGFGLECTVLTHLVMYPDDIRRELGIGDNKFVIMGIAVGYADEEAIINSFKSKRDAHEELVKYFN